MKEIDEVQVELNPEYFKEKERVRRHYRVINDKVVRYNRQGHPFLYGMRKHGIGGALTDDEMKLAKQEWENIQVDHPDTSTFDSLFRRSSDSEWDNS